MDNGFWSYTSEDDERFEEQEPYIEKEGEEQDLEEEKYPDICNKTVEQKRLEIKRSTNTNIEIIGSNAPGYRSIVLTEVEEDRTDTSFTKFGIEDSFLPWNVYVGHVLSMQGAGGQEINEERVYRWEKSISTRKEGRKEERKGMKNCYYWLAQNYKSMNV